MITISKFDYNQDHFFLDAEMTVAHSNIGGVAENVTFDRVEFWEYDYQTETFVFVDKITLDSYVDTLEDGTKVIAAKIPLKGDKGTDLFGHENTPWYIRIYTKGEYSMDATCADAVAYTQKILFDMSKQYEQSVCLLKDLACCSCTVPDYIITHIMKVEALSHSIRIGDWDDMTYYYALFFNPALTIRARGVTTTKTCNCHG